MQHVSAFRYISSGNFAHVFKGVCTDNGENFNVAMKLCITDQEHPEDILMEHENNVMINCARTKSNMVKSMTVEYYPRLFLQKCDITKFSDEIINELQRITVDENEDMRNDVSFNILAKYKEHKKTSIYDQCSLNADIYIHFSSLMPAGVSLIEFLNNLVTNKKTFYGQSNISKDLSLLHVITQVAVFLLEMQQLDPEFTHNDIVPNIFIQPLETEHEFKYITAGINIEFRTLYRVCIIDFGSSRFSVDLRDGTRLKMSDKRQALFAQPFFFVNGIGTLPNASYDIHSLLNYVYLHIHGLSETFPLVHGLINKCVTADVLGLGMIDDTSSNDNTHSCVKRVSDGDLYNGRLSLFPRFFYDLIRRGTKNIKPDTMVQFMHNFMSLNFDVCIDLLPANDTASRDMIVMIREMYRNEEYQQLSTFCTMTTSTANFSNEREKEVYYVGNKIDSLNNILKHISLLFKQTTKI